MGLFDKKPGGSLFGNIFRGVINSATGLAGIPLNLQAPVPVGGLGTGKYAPGGDKYDSSGYGGLYGSGGPDVSFMDKVNWSNVGSAVGSIIQNPTNDTTNSILNNSDVYDYYNKSGFGADGGFSDLLKKYWYVAAGLVLILVMKK